MDDLRAGAVQLSRVSRPEATHGRLTMLFDADCGVCRAIAVRIRRMDRSDRLRMVALQRAATDRPEVAALGRARDLSRSLHVIDESGAWASGGAAVTWICDLVPPLRPIALLGRAPILRWYVEPTYRLIARHRPLLSRAVHAVCGIPI